MFTQSIRCKLSQIRLSQYIGRRGAQHIDFCVTGMERKGLVFSLTTICCIEIYMMRNFLGCFCTMYSPACLLFEHFCMFSYAKPLIKWLGEFHLTTPQFLDM